MEGIIDLLRGNRTPKYLRINGGIVYFFADSSGYKNWAILKNQAGTPKFDIRKFVLTNTEVLFEDQGKFKFYDVWFAKMKCLIDFPNQQARFKLNTAAIIRNASSNTKIGSYLRKKKLSFAWDFRYDIRAQKISVSHQVVRLDGQGYLLTGNFFIGGDPHFDLTIETSNLSLKQAASIFPARTEGKINQFTLSKPLLDVRASLSGSMKYLSFPHVQIHFRVNDASVGVSSVEFQRCSFYAFFDNANDSLRPPDDRNSLMRFTEVKGAWANNQFKSNSINFFNLVQPYLKCDVHLDFALPSLEKVIASRRLDFNGGEGEAQLNFAGSMARTDTVYHFAGTVNVHDADIFYNPRNLRFRHTDIEATFQNGDLLVRKMRTVVNDDKIQIEGRVKNLLNFFSSDSSKSDFEWNIYSPHVDIGKLTTSLHRTSFVRRKKGCSFFSELNKKIDRLLDNCNAYLNIKADKLVYRKFLATNIRGKLTLRNDKVAVDHFGLSYAEGSITCDASLTDNGRNSDLVLRSQIKNVNVRELFAAFNNFGMESLTSKNISGEFSANIDLSSMLDAQNDLYKPANKGYVDFSLQNGRLENFKPLMDIDNQFLQKRGLSDVSFAELNDRFEIDGNDIKINRMEIRSTAVDLYVQGIYSFGSNTDLSIQIPLHDQKKDQAVIPENKGNESKGGISVFLRAKDDKDGKLKIAYDLLGRFRHRK